MASLSQLWICFVCVTWSINGLLWPFNKNTRKPDPNTPTKDEGFHPSNSCPKSETLICTQWVMCSTFGERGPCNESEICCSRKQSLTRGCCVKFPQPTLPPTPTTETSTATTTESSPPTTSTEVTTVSTSSSTLTTEVTTSETTAVTNSTDSSTPVTEAITPALTTSDSPTDVQELTTAIPEQVHVEKEPTNASVVTTTELLEAMQSNDTEAITDSNLPESAGFVDLQVDETTTTAAVDSSTMVSEELTTMDSTSTGGSDPSIGFSGQTGSTIESTIDSTTESITQSTDGSSTQLPLTGASVTESTDLTSRPEDVSTQVATDLPGVSSSKIETTTASTFTTTDTAKAKPCTCTCTCQRPAC